MKQDLIESLATHADFHVGNEHYDKSREEQQRIFMETYTALVIEECRTALSPMLRDMVSRGRAHELIKEHFGVGEQPACQHDWYSAKNQVVVNGSVCVKCGAIDPREPEELKQ